jgi:S-adenosylmethionine decarboxylase
MVMGVHVLAKLEGCPSELIERESALKDIMLKTAKEAGYNIVGSSFHQFEPSGATGVLLLAESHFSIHTWPEKDLVAVDIFTCGNEGDAKLGFDILCKYLKPKKIDKQIVER